MTIKDFMTHDHRRCDEILAQLEDAVEANDWDKAKEKCDEFEHETLKHFDMEESYLFPKFEEQNTGGCGPTHVMRMEHEQVRTVFPKIKEAVEQKDSDRLFGLTESLMILLQQHNSKEEQVLYSMMQDLFGEENDKIVENLQTYEY